MAYKVDPNAYYSKTHEWVRLENDTAVIGISDFAQHNLSDVVFIELPEVGDIVQQGDRLSTVESVKAAEEIYAPVSGEVIAVNTALAEHPQWLNEDPYDKGWLAKIKVTETDLSDLVDASTYEASLG